MVRFVIKNNYFIVKVIYNKYFTYFESSNTINLLFEVSSFKNKKTRFLRKFTMINSAVYTFVLEITIIVNILQKVV